MKKLGKSNSRSKSNFYKELQRRLEENKRLYRGDSPFVVFDSVLGKFVASYLGVNPWKVLIPFSLVIVIFFRFFLGRTFSELVLKVLGG
jgi:hypothetical protein